MWKTKTSTVELELPKIVFYNEEKFDECPITEYKYICPNLSKTNCPDADCRYFHGLKKFLWYIQGEEAWIDFNVTPFIKASPLGEPPPPVLLFLPEIERQLEINYCNPEVSQYSMRDPKIPETTQISANFTEMILKADDKEYPLKRFSTPPKILSEGASLHATNWIWYWQVMNDWSVLKYQKISSGDDEENCPFYTLENCLENYPKVSLDLNVEASEEIRVNVTLSLELMRLNGSFEDEYYSVRRRPTFFNYVEWTYLDDILPGHRVRIGDLNSGGNHRYKLTSETIERQFLAKSGSILYNVKTPKQKGKTVGDQYIIDLEKNTITEKKTKKSTPIQRRFFTPEELIPINDLPPYWSPMPKDIPFLTINVEKGLEEFSNVEKLIQKTLPASSILILQRIQNPRTYATYENYKMVSSTVSTIQEKLLFHGTSDKNIKLICEQNLDPCVGTVNGAAFGTGTYFAKDASYSQRYSIGKNAAAGVVKLFLCKVAVGPYVQGKPSGVSRVAKERKTVTDDDDIPTKVDFPTNPSIFVQSTPNSFYPEYLVELC